jgi:putative ABC transport system substrate-binding protein
MAKGLSFLRRRFPRLRGSPFHQTGDKTTEQRFNEAQVVAKGLGLVVLLGAKGPEDLGKAHSKKQNVQALKLFLRTQVFVATNRARIIELAAKHRLPAIYSGSEAAEAGGLMSYGPDILDNYRRAAIYVDKILKGANPADLPVQQPMKFEFIINLKTAKQIGVTIPPNMLTRADKVIR